MASKITSSPATGEPKTQNEPKRPLMPHKLLVAAIDGNETDLKHLLGLNDEEDHPSHTKVSVDDVTQMEPSDCLKSAAGMEDSILHILSANGHKNLVSTICEKDSSLLKARNVRNETPFHQAARFGHDNTILKLIEHAKSEFGEAELKDLLRQKNSLGETTLHEAARHGHGAVVSTLMEEDLELAGMVNYDSVSPLYLATARGSLPMVQQMVAKMSGHQITLDFYSGPKKQTAMHAAVLLDSELTKELLLLYSEPLGKGADETGRTPLHLIALTGNHHMAELLLDKDPSLAYIQDSDGSFPVHIAVRMGHVGMITLLLERCTDSELTEELLKLNSEPLGKGVDETGGRTPLHFTASTGNHKIAKLLLDKYPSLAYIQDSDGSFPVHTAVRMGHVKMIVLLLKRCPDSGQLLDGNGMNFLHIAIEVKKSDIILKLLEDFKNKLSNSHWKKMFIKMLNTMDNKGNTPLHLAAEHGHDPAVMISLLRSNIELDLTLQNKEGLTAFDILVIRQRKSATYTKSRDMLAEFFAQRRENPFISSTGWFQYYTEDQMSKTELIRGTNEDHISTTDKREAKKSSESVLAKAQLVGLGSVLVATVTFAAAFTLPGGTNQDTGTPILGRKYLFKAFVLADFFAFVSSFASTMWLIYSSSTVNSDSLESYVASSIRAFTFAAGCMVIALGLGLYLVLAPIGNTGAVVLSFALYSTLCMINPFSTFSHISDAASGSNTKPSFREKSKIVFGIYAPILSPFIIIFLFALI